jgi:hypothetical protein
MRTASPRFRAPSFTRFLPTLELATTENGRLFEPQSQLYVATPAVLTYLGINPATIRPDADYLVDRSVATSELTIPSSIMERRSPSRTCRSSRSAPTSSAPTAAATRPTSSR